MKDGPLTEQSVHNHCKKQTMDVDMSDSSEDYIDAELKQQYQQRKAEILAFLNG
jgi:hypothetical protein